MIDLVCFAFTADVADELVALECGGPLPNRREPSRSPNPRLVWRDYCDACGDAPLGSSRHKEAIRTILDGAATVVLDAPNRDAERRLRKLARS